MTPRPLLLTLCTAITADGRLDAASHPEDFARQPGDVLFDLAARDDPAKRLRELRAQDGIRRVLCFGEPQVFRQLFERELVINIYVLVRPKIDGRRGSATLSGMPGEFFPRSIRCRLLRMEVHGRECLLHYRVLRTKAKHTTTV